MYNILLVEDDRRIQGVILEYFRNQENAEYHFETTEDGQEALELLYENVYDLVLLDIMLPGADGFEICKQIRKSQDTPIIFLTARGREEDIIYGYDMGCDDYIVKPFSLAVLQGKMNALLNRSKGTVVDKNLTVGDIVLCSRQMQVTYKNQVVDMPAKEYMILKILMENKGAVVSRNTLIVRIWGYDYDGEERILDNHMKKLRQLLGEGGHQIKTVIRKGYKIVE